TPKKGYVLFETGYGPSGLPHIGTFGEVLRTTMVRRAFEKIAPNIPTRFFAFSDDMDGLRKVPENLPKQEMIKEHLGKPLTSIPDPFGTHESYGHHMNAKLRSFLNEFGFEYEFKSATEFYKSGQFNEYLLKALEHYDEIMNVMLPTLGEERQATYSPFLPICPRTGIVLMVPIIARDVKAGTISYRDTDGRIMEVPVTDGHCKLQWKPDFGIRWAALDVDFEMYGKDHLPNGPIYSKICSIVHNGKVPHQFFYELFLDEKGQKISKSKGNGISLDEWLAYAPTESLALYQYQAPKKAKKLYFDVIPKQVDDYLTYISKYKNEDLEKKLVNPAYHIHNGNVPEINTYGLNFSMLLNLACACNPEKKSVLWGFITKYASGAIPEDAPYLDKLVDFAVKYYNDFVKPAKQYKNPDEADIKNLKDLKEALTSLDDSLTAEEIQNKIYELGVNSGMELKDYFKSIYELLLGQSQGPRLGSFIKLYGRDNSLKLINEKLGL
ncbi:MAG: lysine--tRNA ligase, partial [Methanobacterium sp.]